jgi:hypothetical protein
VSIESRIALEGLARLLRVSGWEGDTRFESRYVDDYHKSGFLRNGLFLSYELSFVMLTVILLLEVT